VQYPLFVAQEPIKEISVKKALKVDMGRGVEEGFKCD